MITILLFWKREVWSVIVHILQVIQLLSTRATEPKRKLHFSIFCCNENAKYLTRDYYHCKPKKFKYYWEMLKRNQAVIKIKCHKEWGCINVLWVACCLVLVTLIVHLNIKFYACTVGVGRIAQEHSSGNLPALFHAHSSLFRAFFYCYSSFLYCLLVKMAHKGSHVWNRKFKILDFL